MGQSEKVHFNAIYLILPLAISFIFIYKLIQVIGIYDCITYFFLGSSDGCVLISDMRDLPLSGALEKKRHYKHVYCLHLA